MEVVAKNEISIAVMYPIDYIVAIQLFILMQITGKIVGPMSLFN
jgi:hypothetical protein